MLKKIITTLIRPFLALVLVACGSSSDNTDDKIIEDNEKPKIECLDDITINIAVTEDNAVVTYTAPKGTDNLSATTTLTEGLASGETFPVGTTTNTFTAIDAAGNKSSCSFNVIINRVEPTLDAPYFIEDVSITSGKTWEAISELTDEFDGPEIDEKWHTNPATHSHLKWVGREPAMFQEKNLKIQDGKMTIEVGKLPEPVTASGWGLNGALQTYTFYGGVFRSKITTNVGNYYECKMKMSKTEMGGGFWLMGFNNTCDKKHEIDITESVGLLTENTHQWAKNQKWDEIYHSNAIRREDSCDSGQDRDSEHITTPTKNHERYYIYGLWRKSATELLFYLDGKYQYTLNPPVPFDQDMYLQFSIESYNWNPIAENGSQVELASLEDRICYVDYIRSFKLVDETN